MSTDIVRYQKSDSGLSEKIFQLDALQLFLEVTLPLMAVTFVGSYGVYWWVHRNETSQTGEENVKHMV